jgi:DinB superfamily
MTTAQIVKELDKNYKELREFVENQQPEFWLKQPPSKWTAGQHVIHLVQSTEPLAKAIKYPKFILKWKFGKNNRPNRDFDTVVTRYKEKLAIVDGQVSSPFSNNMPTSSANEREMWFNKLQKLNQQLNVSTQKQNDSDLDTILLPHPLMGKMTLREILMWNIYHTKHHLDILKNKYTII